MRSAREANPVHRACARAGILLPRWVSFARIFLALFGFSGAVSAQIVNTEGLFRADDGNRARFAADGNFSKDQGNTNLFVFGASAAGRVRIRDHEWLLSANHERASAQDELVGNRSFSHVRYRHYVTDRFQIEAYGQAAQDRFRLMTHRFVAGIGPRFVPVLVGPLTWTLAGSHMYEVERLDNSADFDSLTRKRQRLNLTSSATVEFEKVTLQQTFYVQPAWADPSNIRVLHLLSARATLSEYVSVSWSLEQALDTIAPSDVRALDVRFRSGLRFEL